MANISFSRGLRANLPATGVDGTFYLTTDEAGLYVSIGENITRIGDYTVVAAIANLPANAAPQALYYCEQENVLARWNGTNWIQINSQPTVEELKEALGLGSAAYVDETTLMPKAGGDFTGAVTVQAPTADTNPATKKYVDDAIGNIPAAVDYSVTVQEPASDTYAHVYELYQKDAKVATINIPKDMMIQSGTVETKAEAGEWGDPGTYIHFVLSNSTNDNIYVNVANLVEYVTGAAAADGIITINVDATTHVATATIADTSIPLTKLVQEVQDKINQAHAHADGAKDITSVAGDLTLSEAGALSYSHPTTTAAPAAFVKVGNDEAGHVLVGDAIAASDITTLLDAGEGTYAAKNYVGTFTPVADETTLVGYIDAKVASVGSVTNIEWGTF